jgi:hypothetical protein
MLAFHSWFVRALVDSSSDQVHSATVVSHRHGTIFAPQAWRGPAAGVSRVYIRDVSKTVASADWYSALRNSSSGRCEMGVANRSNAEVFVDSRDVIWTSPFVNCTQWSSHGLTSSGMWMVSLIIPVYNCDNTYTIVRYDVMTRAYSKSKFCFVRCELYDK